MINFKPINLLTPSSEPSNAVVQPVVTDTKISSTCPSFIPEAVVNSHPHPRILLLGPHPSSRTIFFASHPSLRHPTSSIYITVPPFNLYLPTPTTILHLLPCPYPTLQPHPLLLSCPYPPSQFLIPQRDQHHSSPYFMFKPSRFYPQITILHFQPTPHLL